MTSLRRRFFAIAVFVLLVAPATVWAQDSVRLAQGLYAAAAYDEALAVLDRLRESGAPAVDARAIEQHRALCLLALGRSAEAEHAIAAVVQAAPLYRPEEAAASPRVRAAFRDVRSRLLPELVERRYVEARGLYVRGEHAAAAAAFAEVVQLADDPDHPDPRPERVVDLRLLAEGFAELSAKAATPPPAPQPPRTPPEPEEVGVSRIYDANAEGVSPPVVVRQNIPRWPSASLAPPGDGLLEVVIDERGRVESATVTRSMTPLYDKLLAEATAQWLYEPATREGLPVRFRKFIRVAFK